MTYTYGIDVSHWQADAQGRSLIDWHKAYDAGIRFAFVKATDGLNTVRGFKSHMAGARDAGILTAPYHWLYFRDTLPAVAQARAFLTVIQEVQYDLPPVIDYEDRTYAPGAQWCSAYLRGCAGYVEAALDVIPIVYTSFGFWREFGTKAEWVLRHPLWLASYGIEPLQTTYPPTIARRATADALTPAPWGQGNWAFWQFTEKGDGWKYGHTEGDVLDLDVFNGSEAELRRRFGLASGEVVEVPDDALARLWAAHPELWA